MDDDKQGVPPPHGEGPSEAHTQPPDTELHDIAHPDDSYGQYEDPYAYNPQAPEAPPPAPPPEETALAVRGGGGGPPAPPPPPPEGPDEDPEEERTLRMSFIEHLQELRR